MILRHQCGNTDFMIYIYILQRLFAYQWFWKIILIWQHNSTSQTTICRRFNNLVINNSPGGVRTAVLIVDNQQFFAYACPVMFRYLPWHIHGRYNHSRIFFMVFVCVMHEHEVIKWFKNEISILGPYIFSVLIESMDIWQENNEKTQI